VSQPGDLIALLYAHVPYRPWLRKVTAASAQPFAAVETSCSSSLVELFTRT